MLCFRAVVMHIAEVWVKIVALYFGYVCFGTFFVSRKSL